jgi:uncharacterized protein YdiU (UPF0061 family)
MMLYDNLQQTPKVNSFAQLPSDFYTRLPTTSLRQPRLLHASVESAALLGLSRQALSAADFLSIVSGNQALSGGVTLAAVYSGHQFGVWAGQLGDGRAHLLGGIQGPQGVWELQLKGAGSTPYSRMGDGRAVLRSSVREYLASHAMVGLGVPTTRALSLVSAADPVVRETIESAAVVARLAPSFVRFGSFQHWAAHQRPDLLKILADYVIEHFYPECRHPSRTLTLPSSLIGADYVRLLEAVVQRTASLMADWQVYGFCHGVMNTDNMSILGLTLDYGPYGFMDAFDASHICNHTDTQGRYAWHAQPSVAHWNLYQLANSLHLLVPDADALSAALDQFEPCFLSAMQQRMMSKLGLKRWLDGDQVLIDDLWTVMHENHADFTLTFRQLAHASGLTNAPQSQIEQDLGGTVSASIEPFIDLFIDRQAARHWLERYRLRIAAEGRVLDPQRIQSMLASNPLYILRNHLAQQAIERAQNGDPSEIDQLVTLLAKPFEYQSGMSAYSALPPAWASKIEVSCSS